MRKPPLLSSKTTADRNSDEVIFTYLRGEVDKDVTGLEEAKLRITLDFVNESGDRGETRKFTFPLETFARDRIAHLTVRYTSGEFANPDVGFGGPLRPGWNEILTDYWLPGMFIPKGQHTFKFEAFIEGEAAGEERYLFAFAFSQWLDGKL